VGLQSALFFGVSNTLNALLSKAPLPQNTSAPLPERRFWL
jgi:hypothetical protein